MANRVRLTNGLLAAGAALLVAAIFLPIVCVFVMAGGSFVGGCASLWQISPLVSSLMIFIVIAAAGMAMWRRHQELPSALLTTGLFLSVIDAAGISLLCANVWVVHPYWLAAMTAAAGVFLAAAFVAKTPGRSMRFRFHLRTLLLCVTMAALLLGALARA